MLRSLIALVVLTGLSAAQNSAFCDAHQGLCPCGDSTSPYESGCPNSVWSEGASTHFAWNGLWCSYASVVADQTTLPGSAAYELYVLNVPPGSAVVICQGTDQHAPTPFGDGLRCVGGSLIRIVSRNAPNGWLRYPEPGVEPPISIRGAIPPGGGGRYYQTIYRNAASFCTPATFNTTNGWGVSWS